MKLAAGATALPMETTERRMFSLERPGEVGNRPAAVTALVAIEGDYFRTLCVPFRRGRSFLGFEMTPGSPLVVIVNETLARQSFRDRNPVGERIKWGPRDDASAPWMTIVGVVADIKHGRLNEEAFPVVYQPFAQVRDAQIEGFFRFMSLVVQADGVPPAALGSAVTPGRSTARCVAAGVAAHDDRAAGRRHRQPERFSTFLMRRSRRLPASRRSGAVGGAFLVGLAADRGDWCAGGLGAGRGRVSRMVLAQGMLYAVIGLPSALRGSSRCAGPQELSLPAHAHRRPHVHHVSVLLVLVALGARFLPALRAIPRVDPVVALHTESDRRAQKPCDRLAAGRLAAQSA